jgi:tetratricopeptide (TPR) repeat protein
MMILNDSNGALAAQSEAVVADPNQASLRRNRGWNLMNGWRKLALADFEAGLKTDQGPNRADLLLGRSYLLAMEGKIDEALASEADYTKVSDGKPAAMLNYGTVYAQAFEAARRSGNTAKADDLLKRLLKLMETQTMRFPEKVRANAWAAFQADEGFDPIRGIPAFVELNKKLSAVPPTKPTAP